jgi:hypothetical protein
LGRVSKGSGILILLLIIGSVFGSLLGEILGGFLPFLAYGRTIGMDPTTINLMPIVLTLGLTLKLNIATILGFFITLFIYIRL